MGQFLEIANVGPAGPFAAKPSGQALEHFANLVGIENIARIKAADEKAQIVHRLDEPAELQFQKCFANHALAMFNRAASSCWRSRCPGRYSPSRINCWIPLCTRRRADCRSPGRGEFYREFKPRESRPLCEAASGKSSAMDVPYL